VNEYGFTFRSTHYRSFHGQVVKGNHLHWYWQRETTPRNQTDKITTVDYRDTHTNIILTDWRFTHNITNNTILKKIVSVPSTPSSQETTNWAYSTTPAQQVNTKYRQLMQFITHIIMPRKYSTLLIQYHLPLSPFVQSYNTINSELHWLHWLNPL